MFFEVLIIVLTRTRNEYWLTPGSEFSSFGSFSTGVSLSISDWLVDPVMSEEEKGKGNKKGRRIDSQVVGACDDAYVPP